jgi:hypothetical protein
MLISCKAPPFKMFAWKFMSLFEIIINLFPRCVTLSTDFDRIIALFKTHCGEIKSCLRFWILSYEEAILLVERISLYQLMFPHVVETIHRGECQGLTLPVQLDSHFNSVGMT